MWWWWVFTFTHNCVSIFWFIAINVKNPKNPKLRFNGQPNMFFWQDYFLHMWFALKVKHFEPIEHSFFVNGLKKWILCLVALSFKNSKLKFLYDLVFHQVHGMNMYFHGRGHVFVVQKIWNQIIWFYAFLCIPLKKMQFRHLI